MSMSGVRHITISPPLLQALNTTPDSQELKSLFEDKTYTDKILAELPEQKLNLIDDEERFRMLFTRRDGGKQEIKQVKAINVFADMQERLEDIVRPYLA